VNAHMMTSDGSMGFPRFFKVGGYRVSAYKVFLCIGIYSGILVSAAVAARSGIPPLRMGAGSLACAISGLFGARIYHLIVFAPHYLRERSWTAAWDSRRGGWSVFGALLPIAPLSFLVASVLLIPPAVFFDHMIWGIVVGAIWVRFGCICNGCCGGRGTQGWLAWRAHNVQGANKRRIPVQLLEMGWWLLALGGLFFLWGRPFSPGTFALAGLGWYGLGRFWLEPLRETPDLVFGRVRINQVVAACLAIAAGGGLCLLNLKSI
jgi:phosphatidylglycerol:prolipoprotein diacylglycerol transferase